jgi:hypothetical protein
VPEGRQEVLQTRGEEQFKEAGSRQLLASSLKTQAQGRKDTPSRSKDSSSFKTQQTGQGRRPKAEFKVHSDHLQEELIQAVHSDQTMKGGRIQVHHNLPTITPHLAED